MSLGQVIRKRRQEKDMTQDDVAARVNISKPYLSNIETEKVKNPPSDRVIALLEQALSFTPGELKRMAHEFRTPLDIRTEHEQMAAEVERLRGLVKGMASGQIKPDAGRKAAKPASTAELLSAGRPIPIINKVSAGYPHHFTDMDYPAGVADEYVRTPDVHDPQAFGVRVWGDSMEPRYHEGDIVVLSPALEVRAGDDCFVRFVRDGSTTFKRYQPARGGKIRLEALNSKYESETYEADDISGLWPAVMKIEKLR